MAVIFSLVLIMTGVSLWLKRHKLKSIACLAQPAEYDDVVERHEAREGYRTGGEMEMKINEAYEPTALVKSQSREKEEIEDGQGLYEEIN